MADFTIKEGDRLPGLSSQLLDSAGNPIPLAGTTVTLRMRLRGDDTLIVVPVTIVDEDEATVEVSPWPVGATDVVGVFYAEFRIDYGSDLYMRVPNTGDFTIEVVPNVESSTDENELLLSVDELKDIYLFGTDLTDDQGNPFPARMYRHYIAAAVAWLEKELDVKLEATDIVDEEHDHMAEDYNEWGYFQLENYPVISMDEVSFRYPGMSDGVVIDAQWIKLMEKGAHGVIQIVPGQGNINDVLWMPGALLPMWSAGGRVPAVWHFNYRAGFEVGYLPADLKHAIGMAAAIGPFNIAGDLIVGAGIGSMSMSLPGLSQSVSTTQSAMYGGYGSRVLEYQKELKEMVPNLRRFYGKATRMYVA